MSKEHKRLMQEFGFITQDLTLMDWRNIRDANYWKCDNITDECYKLMYKIKIIKDWVSKNK